MREYIFPVLLILLLPSLLSAQRSKHKPMKGVKVVFDQRESQVRVDREAAVAECVARYLNALHDGDFTTWTEQLSTFDREFYTEKELRQRFDRLAAYEMGPWRRINVLSAVRRQDPQTEFHYLVILELPRARSLAETDRVMFDPFKWNEGGNERKFGMYVTMEGELATVRLIRHHPPDGGRLAPKGAGKGVKRRGNGDH